MIISLSEARKFLGDTAKGMSDDEVIHLINSLDEIAKLSLEHARKKLIEEDASKLALLIYDIYKDSRLE